MAGPIRAGVEDRFDELILAIADELGARKLVSYEARRLALPERALDEQTWQQFVARRSRRTDCKTLLQGPHHAVGRHSP